MTYLILGVALWSVAHLFKRIAPAARASMGMAGKGLVAVLVLVSIGLMVMGYQSASGAYFWGRSAAMVGINNLLMLLAVYLMVISVVRVKLNTKIRNPQLTAVKTWAVAHLLVNGDVPSFVLFGGLIAWAVISVILIGKQDGKAPIVVQSSLAKEAVALVATVVIYGAIAALHMHLGYPVFGK